MNGGDYGYNSNNGGRPSYAERTYSLPRTVLQHQQQQQMHHQYQQNPGYYTQDRRSRSHQQPSSTTAGTDTPDFYFMPSQRKYSGEVVRVYVDYNNEPKE